MNAITLTGSWPPKKDPLLVIIAWAIIVIAALTPWLCHASAVHGGWR